MKRLLLLAVVTTLGACASNDPGALEKNPKKLKNEAIEDFIKVTELEPVHRIRVLGTLQHDVITEDYIFVTERRNTWLIAFASRCYDIEGPAIHADIRYDHRVLRSGVDTIRGCRIDDIYEVSEGMVEEIKGLTAPYDN